MDGRHIETATLYEEEERQTQRFPFSLSPFTPGNDDSGEAEWQKVTIFNLHQNSSLIQPSGNAGTRTQGSGS